MSTSGQSSNAKRSATRHQNSAGASQSSGFLLPRRPKQHNHQPSLRRKHRRSYTAPLYTERSLSSCSSSSFQSGEETNRSTCTSNNGQGTTNQTFSCHISCRVSPDKPGHFEFLKPYSVFRAPLKQSKSLPSCFTDSYTMQHPDLDSGQKTYLWQTASVYSMSNMKALQQRRYKQLLQHQVDIGFHTQEECDRYLQYLLRTRKRQFIADPSVWRNPPKIPVRQKSSASVPPPSRAQPYRDYRYYPRGYEDTNKGQAEDGTTSLQEKNAGEMKDQRQEPTDEGKGRIEAKGHDDSRNQTEGKGKDDVENAKDENKEASQQENDTKSDSDDDDNLSESVQGMSLYYDPQRKTTVTRGKNEKEVESQENAGNDEGKQKSKAAKTNHQNCFWGSH